MENRSIEDVIMIIFGIAVVFMFGIAIYFGYKNLSADLNDLGDSIRNVEAWKEENPNANIFIESCNSNGATGTTEFDGHELKVEATSFNDTELYSTYIVSDATLYIDDEKIGKYTFENDKEYSWNISDDTSKEIWEAYGESVAEDTSDDYVYEGIKAFVYSVDKSYSEYVNRNDSHHGLSWIALLSCMLVIFMMFSMRSRN